MASEISLLAARALVFSNENSRPKRFILYNLLDMNRFAAQMAIVLCRDLANQTAILSMTIDESGTLPLAQIVGSRDRIVEVLGQLIKNPEELPLNWTLRQKIERLRDRLITDDVTRLAQVEALLKDLLNDIITDLAAPYFLMVPRELRAYYEQRQPLFGPLVEKEIEGVAEEIAAAGRCLALGEWTASVFHLMRVLEKGLHRLAAHLEIPMSATFELENWKNIIDQIESAVRKMENLPKSLDKSESLRELSEMASSFWYFKEAWRNHVSHSRASYNERQTIKVYNAVQDVMCELAKFLEAKGTAS